MGFMAITISLTVHEYAHAWTADRLGDDTPRRAGHLSLNPAIHWKTHPFGALIAPILGAMNGMLFGWATTPVNPARARRGINIRTADFLISGAGAFSNILLAGVAVGTYYGLGALGAEWAVPLVQLSAALVVSNIFLALFNVLPIPPLDGAHMLFAKAPRSWAPVLTFIEQYSFLLFLVIFFSAGRLIWPVITLVVPDEIIWAYISGTAK